MNIHPFFLPRPALVLAGLLAFAAGLGSAAPAAAEDGPALDSDRTCLEICIGQRRHCLHACRVSVSSCLRSARVETRLCRRNCLAQFEADTPERESCLAACRHDVLEPAVEACRALATDCAPECLPGRCRVLCGPDGGGLDETGECRARCAGQLRRCSRETNRQLRDCLIPCREIDDLAEKEACAQPCFEAARQSAADCQEDLRSCSAACEDPTTTTTLLD